MRPTMFSTAGGPVVPDRHPRGSDARVLLSSVFGPYAQDDDYGSRRINPMELYHNQVTRAQGGFSLRLFHRSFGLMLLQSNMDAPCWLLDFPTLDRFVEELRTHTYDIVGISSIIPNVGKVAKMCELVRSIQPAATIVVGGHIANKPRLADIIDADHIVRGDGVRWFRDYLGEPVNAPLRHPLALSAFGGRVMGMSLSAKARDTAAVLIPSVGCPLGCNFCSTSAMFGGKGKFINFYKTGDELFSLMCGIEARLGVRSFFVMDENFLLHRKRALRLLQHMEQQGKSWSLYVFSSARVLRAYSIEQLVRLGVSWVWMGLEGEQSQYRKLKGVDTQALVRHLQSHGIRVLGSTIIGLENHTVEGMPGVIDYAVGHDVDFHQFMLYTPIPGTPLYEEHRQAGTLSGEDECPSADTHGQYRFSFHHPHIRLGEEIDLIVDAFRRDFEINGPSLARVFRTTLAGWKRYKDHPDLRIRERFAAEVKDLRGSYAAALWAMRRWARNKPRVHETIASVLRTVYAEFGWSTRLKANLLGPLVAAALKREQKRLAKGGTLEPSTFYEGNPAAVSLDGIARAHSAATAIDSVSA